MNRNEQQMYSDITSIRKSLEKIANALDNNVLDNVNYKPEINPADLCNVIEYKDGVKNDSDYRIRLVASNYEDDFIANGHTKKECILHYVTEDFGSQGARYTDIIKFAYYLGAHNAPKYTSESRGYYAMAFAPRYGGHLIQGGKDQLVKGINKDGKERYFTLSFVDNVTDYYKRLDQ